MGIFKRKPAAPLQVTYRAKATEGGPDQVLTVSNRSDRWLVPTLSFRTSDPYARDLPHVEVGSVLGVDRGAVAIPPGQSVDEILRFRGQGYRSVRYVQPVLHDVVELANDPLTNPVESLMIDLEQRRTSNPEHFWGIGLTNPNDIEVDVLLVLVEYETDTPKDQPRQVVDCVQMQDTVRIPAQGNNIVWLPDDVRGTFHAVRHHVVPHTIY